ncbi:Dabb family protein [Verrucomicrobiaceae bacterium R5-34]|uniref:Dabb family protein n=1 Tax=Oceaniferula flava TaxID=2800421 RepID=A0AAE2SBK6_9BACT|nr:Dabb family protein [Oceaniferula flavus]MBK1831284.1 Dabb family protein [Verrucomicrobiaceae bacterium R5-34]MBK1855453.1 Dabb family protein [Oceaniferula flavus]MBM1136759.1 Dabb family protein [Oceaniferula flavus]
MKTITLILALSFASLISAFAHDHGDKKAPFRHVVCFKFKADATPEQIKTVEKAFAALPSKIDTIKGYEWGTSLGGVERAKGFTHCFVVTFDNQAGLDAYSPHDAHQAFIKLFKPFVEDVFVFDYIAQ